MAIYIGKKIKKIQKVLKKICPCFVYTVGKLQKMKLNGKKGKFAKLSAFRNINNKEFCACYCNHRAGCNLIYKLINHEKSITIQYNPRTKKGYKYFPDTNTVEAGPFKSRKIDTNKGKKKARTFMKLAHELIHALDDMEGKLNVEDGSRTEEEDAVRGGNQIRKEAGMDYHRTTHKGKEVPNPTQKYLDDSDLFRCECKESPEDNAKK